MFHSLRHVFEFVWLAVFSNSVCLLIILNKLHHLNLLFRLFIRENHTNQLLKTAKLPSQPPSNGLAEVIHGGFGLDKFKLESLRRILYFSSYVKEATYCSHTGRLGGPICGYLLYWGNSGVFLHIMASCFQ